MNRKPSSKTKPCNSCNMDKFIEHVANNIGALNEYSVGEMRKLMSHFKDEADTFNVKISDEDLEKYIKRFDDLKNSPNIKEKDLGKYTLKQLFNIVRSSTGGEKSSQSDEDEDYNNTPDIVHNENGVIIYSGHKEGNCVMYGRGERWCITRTAFPGYRSSAKEKTFYLVKDTNKRDSSEVGDSFFVIHVNKDGSYQWTDRTNSPSESSETTWSGIEQKFPVLRGLKSKLKYIPLSKAEKQQTGNGIDIREWITDLDFEEKKTYLVKRKEKIGGGSSNSLFKDISNVSFIHLLKKFPKVEEWIAKNPSTSLPASIVATFIGNMDQLHPQNQKSFFANLHDTEMCGDRDTSLCRTIIREKQFTGKVPFISGLWAVKANPKLMVGDDFVYIYENQYIVYLTINNETITNLAIYGEDVSYPNVKINEKTEKYIINPHTIKHVPSEVLINTAEKYNLDLGAVNDKVTGTYTRTTIGDNEVLINPSTLSVLRVTPEGNKKLDLSRDEDQKLFADTISDNDEFNASFNSLIAADDLKGIVKKFPDLENIPQVFNKIPTNKYKAADGRLLVPSKYGLVIYDNMGKNIFANTTYPAISRENQHTIHQYQQLFNEMRKRRVFYTGEDLRSLMGTRMSSDFKKNFVLANPPMDPNSTYTPRIVAGVLYLVNNRNPSDSMKVSNTTGNLLRASIRPAMARQAADPVAPVGGVRRRGRPAGVPNAPRAANAPLQQPEAGGHVTPQVANRLAVHNVNYLPSPSRAINRYIGRFITSPGTFTVNPTIDRGASRRNNLLAGNGRVVEKITSGSSVMYIIQLNSGRKIASLVIQPGNGHFILAGGQAPIRLTSADGLTTALTNHHINEGLKSYIIQEFGMSNPHLLEETKIILKKYLILRENEKKRTKKTH